MNKNQLAEKLLKGEISLSEYLIKFCQNISSKNPYGNYMLSEIIGMELVREVKKCPA